MFTQHVSTQQSTLQAVVRFFDVEGLLVDTGRAWDDVLVNGYAVNGDKNEITLTLPCQPHRAAAAMCCGQNSHHAKTRAVFY